MPSQFPTESERMDHILADIYNDRNPVVEFAETYQMRQLLVQRGFFAGGACAFPFRYRVDHGRFMTQNAYKFGSRSPSMVDIPFPEGY